MLKNTLGNIDAYRKEEGSVRLGIGGGGSDEGGDKLGADERER